MKKKILRSLLATLLAVSVFPFAFTTIESASLTSISDTMSRLKAGENSNHTISFVTPTGVGAGEKIKVTFSDNFASGLNGINYGDMDLADNGSDLTLAATCSGSTWGAAVSSRTITFTSCTGTIAGTSTVTIEIGTNANYGGDGDTQIANPSSAGSNTIRIVTTTSGDTEIDTGALAVAIMSADQVTVSATVDPSITSELSSSTCSLGTLTNTAVSFCSYTNTVNTNASSGYVATIQDDGNLRNGANDINDAGGDNDVDQGSEEYGAATSKASQTIVQYTTCANNNPQPASALTTSAQQYASSSGPVSNDATTLCHAASIAGSTPAGSYSHITTHITTGTF